MAVEFRESEKRQKILIYVFAVVVLVTLLVLWLGYFKPEKPLEEAFLPPVIKKIEINWDVLKNPFLENLQTFEGLPPLPPEEEIGRENPFLPY